MKKIKFDDCICQDRLLDHEEVKDSILSCIDKSPDGGLSEDGYGYDLKKSNITKLDWDRCREFENRPWLYLFLPKFTRSVQDMVNSMGYKSIRITACWYQQYLKGSSHSWHIHNEHYTGVYYLEYPEGSSKTEICSPYDLTKQTLDVSEGDFIIFPAHWIHRSPSNSSSRKTIISYNFSIEMNYPKGYYLDVDAIKDG